MKMKIYKCKKTAWQLITSNEVYRYRHNPQTMGGMIRWYRLR
jgi:hypothetical protein